MCYINVLLTYFPDSLRHSYPNCSYPRHIWRYNKHASMTLLNTGTASNVKSATDSFPYNIFFPSRHFPNFWSIPWLFSESCQIPWHFQTSDHTVHSVAAILVFCAINQSSSTSSSVPCTQCSSSYYLHHWCIILSTDPPHAPHPSIHLSVHMIRWQTTQTARGLGRQ